MEQTRGAVLDSAARCFARYGFRKTSIDTIAGEAHVAKGTVYLYCANKQELFYQAVHRELATWIEGLSDLIDPDVPADEILTEMGRRDAAFVEERPLVSDLLSGLYDSELPAWKEQFAELRELATGHVVEVLRLGIHQGVFADDLDVTATARVLQEMQVSGSLLRHRSGLSLRQVRRQQSAALHLVLKGLEARTAG